MRHRKGRVRRVTIPVANPLASKGKGTDTVIATWIKKRNHSGYKETVHHRSHA